MDVKFNPWVVLLTVFMVCITLNSGAWGQFPVQGGQFRPSHPVVPSNPASHPINPVSKPTFQSRTAHEPSPTGSQTSKVNWIDGKNLGQALQQAIKENKPVMLHFWNQRCRPCMALEQFVFPNPLLAQVINSQFIPVKVNTMETPDIHKKYGVTRWPWDVFISPQGVKLFERASPNNVSQYVQNINSVAKMQSNLMKSAPVQDRPQLVNHLKPTQNPFESRISSATAPSETPQRSSQIPTGTHGFQSPKPASPISAPQAVQASSSSLNPVRLSTQPPTPKVNQPQVASLVKNSFFHQQQGKKPAASPVAQTHPPMGLEGFCPVSLLRETKKVAGSKEWGCIHRGKLYFFTNQANRDRFMEDPDRYAPVLAGYDVVVYRETGNLVEGKSIFGGFVGEKENRVVFLFASEENKNKFINDKTGRYVEAARVATKNTNENWLR